MYYWNKMLSVHDAMQRELFDRVRVKMATETAHSLNRGPFQKIESTALQRQATSTLRYIIVS